MTQPNLKWLIECFLLVSDGPLGIDKIKSATNCDDAHLIRKAILELSAEYETRAGGVCLAEVAGGYQLRTRPEYSEWVKKFLQPPPQRLSQAALETLAIVAYKQPIIRSEIEHIRGVESGAILRMLLERKLIRIAGRKEIPGRPLIYATTRRFLEVFGLIDLKDLPSPKEMAELSEPIVSDT
jgi:segregation and condensation protein B